MKIGAIILSRFNSSRLPGKALMEINQKPILGYILERLKVVLDEEQITIATSEEATDDPIAHFADRAGVSWYRGSLDNVSLRFLNCGLAHEWDYLIRINGDNVFVDINLLRDMIMRAETNQYDFLSNVKDRTYPKGMSIEIVKTSYYQDVYKKMTNPGHFEHVTSYLYERDEENFFYFRNQDYPEAAGIQLALDTPEDFARTKFMLNRLPNPHWDHDLSEIMKTWKEWNDNSPLEY